MAKKELLAIDGDEFIYKAAFSAQHKEHWIRMHNGDTRGPFSTKKLAVEWLGDGDADELYIVVVPKTESQASDGLKRIIGSAIRDVRPTDHRLYLTGKDNFRYEVATLLPYKGNRKDADKPFHFDFLKDLIINQYNAITVDGIEADDAMSITSWQHQIKDTSWEVTIATQDKDLKMVPGFHYNPTTRKRLHLDPYEARLYFYKQLLTGDGTDNIPGISGMGPATANKVLDPIKDESSRVLYEAVLAQYTKAENNPKVRAKMPEGVWGRDRVVEVGRLLWMLQERDQMWVPEEEYYVKG